MRLQALTKCAAVAGALALPLTLGATAASATTGGAGSALAVGATGPVAIPATPSVTSTAQRPERKSVAELPANPLVEARLLNAAAWSGHARASVADLKVARFGLTASAVTAKCENGNGISHLVKATMGGRTLKAGATPNTIVTIAVPQVGNATVTLNKHVRDTDGNLTVTAIEVSATIAGKTQTLSIASVNCGKAVGQPGQPGQPGEPGPSDPGTPSSPATPPGEAPAPTPVPGDLPVTG
ncbi:choice-of-anchor P family protein [Spirillospora sp. CA-142024]|uniref:choice-of-anchor P family protein n=1 Tax=Spirillospora sp. CA-142024 TaxID=3240036 RepID=UPI003D8DE5D0